MSDVVARAEGGMSMAPSEGDLVDLYIARTEELRRIAAKEEVSDRLVFAYDARRQAAVALVEDPGDSIFLLANRRPDLVEQIQADVGAQSVIDTIQRPPSSSTLGGGGAQALADARASLEALRQAVLAPETAEEAARARGLVERDAERIISDAGMLYAVSRRDPEVARGLLATVYEPAEMEPAAVIAAGRVGERWRAADEAAAEAAARQDVETLAAARRAREAATSALLENRLGIYALAQSPSPLSARAEMSLDAEARSLMGAAPGTDDEIDRDLQQALGARAEDPAARYAWLAEEAMAADAGHRRVRLAPRLRMRAAKEARRIEAARLDPALGDRLGVARLAALAKEGRPWLARAFGHDRKPDEPLPEVGTAGRTPDLESYAAEQASGAGAVAKGLEQREAVKHDAEAKHERFAVDAKGNRFFTAKRLNKVEEGSPSGLFAAYMPRKDGDLVRLLRNPETPALALPFSKWSGSPTIDRELTYLYKNNPDRFWSLFEGSRNLSMAILKKEGGIRSLTGEEQEAFDHLQLGLRAMAMVAVKQNPREHEARVEDPLQPLLSSNALAMIEGGRRSSALARAVRDPDGLIQGGRKDQFTERLAEKGLIPSLKKTIEKTADDIRRVVGGLPNALVASLIEEASH